MKQPPVSFWCSGCKIDHPGECPPSPPDYLEGEINRGHHDWQKLPIITLINPYLCQKCQTEWWAPWRPVGPPELPPDGPCPGAPMPAVDSMWTRENWVIPATTGKGQWIPSSKKQYKVLGTNTGSTPPWILLQRIDGGAILSIQ